MFYRKRRIWLLNGTKSLATFAASIRKKFLKEIVFKWLEETYFNSLHQQAIAIQFLSLLSYNALCNYSNNTLTFVVSRNCYVFFLCFLKARLIRLQKKYLSLAKTRHPRKMDQKNPLSNRVYIEPKKTCLSLKMIFSFV